MFPKNNVWENFLSKTTPEEKELVNAYEVKEIESQEKGKKYYELTIYSNEWYLTYVCVVDGDTYTYYKGELIYYNYTFVIE